MVENIKGDKIDFWSKPVKPSLTLQGEKIRSITSTGHIFIYLLNNFPIAYGSRSLISEHCLQGAFNIWMACRQLVY